MTARMLENGAQTAELRRQAAAEEAAAAGDQAASPWLPVSLQRRHSSPGELSPAQQIASIAARLSASKRLSSSNGTAAEEEASAQQHLPPLPPRTTTAAAHASSSDVLAELHAALQAAVLDAQSVAEADARCAALQGRLHELQRRLLASEHACAELREEVRALEAERDAARALAVSEGARADAARAAAVVTPHRSGETVAVDTTALRDAHVRLHAAEADAAAWRRRCEELRASLDASAMGHVSELEALRRELTSQRATGAALELALKDAEARAATHRANDAALREAATAAEAAVASVERGLGPQLQRERARADAAEVAATQAAVDAAQAVEQLLRAVAAREADVANRERDAWARERDAYAAGHAAGYAAGEASRATPAEENWMNAAAAATVQRAPQGMAGDEDMPAWWRAHHASEQTPSSVPVAQAPPASTGPHVSPGAAAKLKRLMEAAASLRAELVSAVAAGAAARADAALHRANQRAQRDTDLDTPVIGA